MKDIFMVNLCTGEHYVDDDGDDDGDDNDDDNYGDDGDDDDGDDDDDGQPLHRRALYWAKPPLWHT